MWNNNCPRHAWLIVHESICFQRKDCREKHFEFLKLKQKICWNECNIKWNIFCCYFFCIITLDCWCLNISDNNWIWRNRLKVLFKLILLFCKVILTLWFVVRTWTIVTLVLFLKTIILNISWNFFFLNISHLIWLLWMFSG